MAEPSGNELASAAAKGDLVQLTNLLQKNVNVNAQNGFGRTALQVGIQRGKEMFHHWLPTWPGVSKKKKKRQRLKQAGGWNSSGFSNSLDAIFYNFGGSNSLKWRTWNKTGQNHDFSRGSPSMSNGLRVCCYFVTSWGGGKERKSRDEKKSA